MSFFTAMPSFKVDLNTILLFEDCVLNKHFETKMYRKVEQTCFY